MTVAAFPAPAPLRILLIEDADADAQVVENVLQEYAFIVRRAGRLGDALIAVRSEQFDAILADLGLPDSAGLATVEALRQHAVAIPIVVMTGRADESTALRAVAAGAEDYLVKGNTDAGTLVRAIRYAVERGHAHESINVSEAHLRNILEGALDAVVSMNQDGLIMQWNRSAEEIFGWPRGDVLGMPLVDVIVPERFRERHQFGVQTFSRPEMRSSSASAWKGLPFAGTEASFLSRPGSPQRRIPTA